MTYSHLAIATTTAGVRTIMLDRPERLNAVNSTLATELPAALTEAAWDDNVRVVVITGAGRGFCAGLDLRDPALLDQSTRVGRLDDLGWVGRWVLAMASCEKPVIAAVNGPAAGAGFGLALAADLRLVSTAATLTAGYVRVGLSPDAGMTYYLPRIIGLGPATDILLTGRDVSAEEALRLGLATSVYPAEKLHRRGVGLRRPPGRRPSDRARPHQAAAPPEPRHATPAPVARRAHPCEDILRVGCRTGCHAGVHRAAEELIVRPRVRSSATGPELLRQPIQQPLQLRSPFQRCHKGVAVQYHDHHSGYAVQHHRTGLGVNHIA